MEPSGWHHDPAKCGNADSNPGSLLIEARNVKEAGVLGIGGGRHSQSVLWFLRVLVLLAVIHAVIRVFLTL